MANEERCVVPKMMGLRDAAKTVGLSYDYLRKLCNKNEVAHIRAGKKFFINLNDLAEYLANAGKN